MATAATQPQCEVETVEVCQCKSEDVQIRPYAVVFIHPTGLTGVQPSLTAHQTESHSDTQIAVSPTTDVQPEDEVAQSKESTTTTVTDDAQQVESTPSLTPTATVQLESLTAQTVNPYAEISIIPATAQPNLENDGRITTGTNPYSEITIEPANAQPEPAVMGDSTQDHDINPYARITFQPPPEIASSTPENCEDTSVDPTTTTRTRRMSLDPQSLEATGTAENDEGVGNRSGNRSRRRLRLGARLFLKSTAGSEGTGLRSSVSKSGGIGRRRLTLGLRNFRRERASGAESAEESSPNTTDLLASLRSSGVSFQTNNPGLRKTVAEMEPRLSSDLGRRTRRRAMSVGARFFHRPLSESSTDSGRAERGRRRMSVGARFLHTVTGGTHTSGATTSEPRSQLRMSIRARIFRNSQSPTTSRSGRITNLKARFFKQPFSTIPEDSPAAVSGGEVGQSEAPCRGEDGRSKRRMSFGARLLQRFTIHEESPNPPPPPPPPDPCDEDSCSTSSFSSEDSFSDSEEVLYTLRASGVVFPTNSLLESRERRRRTVSRSLATLTVSS